jgi:UDP-glucose 4-epimerase
MRLLVTGGAGYIGSHTVLLLIQSGFEVIVLDNLCNSSEASISRVSKITGTNPIFINGDVRDSDLLNKLFAKYRIHSVLHFAGLKAVEESVSQPLLYYDNNVSGSCVLFKSMAEAGIFNLIFSSSATVYGDSAQMPILETCSVDKPTNPYGLSKLMIEDILRDLAFSDPRWHVAILRYFNPVGAHESGLIGEDPQGIPNNLLPYIAKVASAKLPHLIVYGNDYPTIDGTGVRDYIHVMDLAKGHLSALRAFQLGSGTNVWNLGTGRGYSVLEIVKAFEIASGRHIPYVIAPRRVGDIATCYADPSKAQKQLGWRALRGLSEMMRDTWRWQLKNPDGYKTKGF